MGLAEQFERILDTPVSHRDKLKAAAVLAFLIGSGEILASCDLDNTHEFGSLSDFLEAKAHWQEYADQAATIRIHAVHALPVHVDKYQRPGVTYKGIPLSYIDVERVTLRLSADPVHVAASFTGYEDRDADSLIIPDSNPAGAADRSKIPAYNLEGTVVNNSTGEDSNAPASFYLDIAGTF